MNIHPISDLQNYSKALKEVTPDEPLFLSENGQVKYVILDIEHYAWLQSELTALGKLEKT